MDKRLIFTISTGRCGTRYLTEMLETVPGIDAVHEPKPEFSDAARLAQFVPEAATKFWRKVKLPAIGRYEKPIYFETSHVVSNGFIEPLLRLGIKPDIVTLARPHRETALSRWWRGSIPARTERGCQHAIHPNAIGNQLMISEWEDLSDYQLCYWFSLEIAARADWYTGMFDGLGTRVHRTSMGTIATEDGFLGLLEAMDLPEPDMALYRSRKGIPSNVTPEWAKRIPPGDLNVMEQEVRDRVVESVPSKEFGKPSVHIFLINTGSIREELSSWIGRWLADKRFDVKVEGARGFPVCDNRGHAVLKFLAGGRDYMLMVDADVVPQRNVLDLVEKNLDVVVFPTPIWRPKKSPQLPVMLNVTLLANDGEAIEGDIQIGNTEDLHPVSSGGTGCILITRRVLEHHKMFHAFRDLWRFDGTRSIGNDIWFVSRARAAGFEPVAAMRYPCSHFKMIDLLHAHMVYDELMKTAKGDQDAMV